MQEPGWSGERLDGSEVLKPRHTRDQERLQRKYDTQAVMNSLLRLSLEEIPIRDLLQRSLDLLLSIQWLAFQSKGNIFIVEEDPEFLVMRAWSGIPDSLVSTCGRLPFGRCLCGNAALKRKILFVDGINEQHENHYEGMDSHGHYCVPILYSDEVLGVINIYVSAGHRRDREEEEFLMAIAHTLAGILIRRRTEEALQKSEKSLRDITSALGEGVFVLDREGRLLFINPEAEHLLGWKKKEIVQQKMHPLIHTKTREDSSHLYECPVMRVFRTGRRYRTENDTFFRKDGSEFPVSYVATPIFEQGEVVASVTAFADITEKKILEDELARAQKLESIGVLAGGIAHDFNNLLTAIWGNLNLAKAYVGSKDHLISERLSDAEEAIRRAKALTHQLLIFSRGGEPIRRTTSLTKWIKGAANFSLSGSSVKCLFSIPADLSPVDVDEGQMSQVIHNLILNARQAMPGGGTIRVACEETVLKKRNPFSLKPGKYVKIRIEDYGVGIRSEDLPKIFDPFFTTKPESNGLGLTTAYSIVQKHHGVLAAESRLGKGTAMMIYLPVSEKKIQPRKAVGEELRAGGGKVLLMDDEEIVRAVAGQMLSRIGYQVEFAVEGRDAVELYRQARESGEPFDAVIMDLTVPGGMGGLEAVRKLRRIDPDVKAVVSSGYSDDPVLSDYREYGFSGVLPKPYKIIELSEVLETVLSGE